MAPLRYQPLLVTLKTLLMTRLDKYIGHTVTISVLATLLVILGLDIISAVIDQLSSLGGNYQFLDALEVVAWSLPGRIYNRLGFAALVGCMVGLGSLAGTSELTVIRASGVSIKRISWAVIKPLLVLIGLGLLLAQWVIPVTNQESVSRKAMAQGKLQATGLEQGLWLQDEDEFVHFNAALPNGVLFGITRYRFDQQHQLQRVIFSDRGQFNFANGQWLLEANRETTFATDLISSDHQPQIMWKTDISPEVLSLIVPPAEDLSPSNLWTYGKFLDDKGEDSSRYWLQFWKKILQPLTIAGLVMMAVSFIFGPLREVTTGLRVFTGVIVGLVFQTLQEMLGPSSLVFGFSPFIAVLLPIVLSFLAGWYLLKRAH